MTTSERHKASAARTNTDPLLCFKCNTKPVMSRGLLCREHVKESWRAYYAAKRMGRPVLDMTHGGCVERRADMAHTFEWYY